MGLKERHQDISRAEVPLSKVPKMLRAHIQHRFLSDRMLVYSVFAHLYMV